MTELSFFDFIDNCNNLINQSSNINSCNEKLNIKETCTDREEININDMVKVKYDGVTYVGKVVHTYYEGNAINVVFDNKYTTFHRSTVEKIN